MAEAKELLVSELHLRLGEEGFDEIRAAHGCVFRFVEPTGTRLTVLAEQSGLSKQAVGEVADDLQRLGYAERLADPADGRAKLIRLTERGTRSREAALRIMDEIEAEWAERYGEEAMATLRGLLEAVTGQAVPA